MLKKIHPYILAILPSLFIGGRNLAEVPLLQIFIATFASLCIIAAFLWASRLLSANREKAIVLTSLFIIITFSFSVLYNTLAPFFLGHTQLLSIALTILIYLFFLSCAHFLFRYQKAVEAGNVFLGYLSVSMLLCVSISIVSHPHFIAKLKKTPQYLTTRTSPIIETNPLDRPSLKEEPAVVTTNQPYPDIYYIIVDGYARNDTLLNTFGYDNTQFTEYLKKKGFYIAQKSSSNYPMTHLSLASSLSLDYINPLIHEYGIKDNSAYFNLIKNAKAASILRAHGYEYITIASGWGPTNESSMHSDIHFNRKINLLPIYYQSILMQTPLRPFFGLNEARLRLFALEKLAQIPTLSNKPKFTFLHLVMPHPPYLFDKQGNILNLSSNIHDHHSQKSQYIEQLQFLNSKLYHIIDSIIAKSTMTPIILIQADHGSEVTLENYRSGAPSKAQIRERFAIFNAYYGPPEFKNSLYSTISPVNSFRCVFNFLKIGSFELLPDKNYFQWYYDDSEIYDVSQEFIAMNLGEN